MSENITNNPSVPTQIVGEVKFPRFINNLGIIPTSYKDSMSYYETLAWLCKYLEETVIPTVNQNGKAVQELQGLYIQLNDYVTHYFDNLDVQKEINNKLDDMVEAGTLDEIINQEIFGDLNDEIDNIKNNTIGNLENLTTLKNNSLVEAINTNNQLQEVFLGNGIIYEIPQDVGHVQGSCIHANNLYVAVQGTSPNGFIYVFNINNNSYVTRYENIPLYHGNDMTYINDKLYIASYDSLKIVIYDLILNTTTEINPFTDYSGTYGHITGVEKIDDNNILCLLTKDASNVTDYKFLKLNLTTLDSTEYTLNDEYSLTNYSTTITPQNICLDNNNLYILLALPHIILQATILESNINFTKIYNLPAKDINGNPVGEMESLALINHAKYPAGSIMITGRTFETFKDLSSIYTEDTITNYIFSPKTGNVNYPILASGQYPVRGTNCFGYYSVSKSVGNLIEDGTAGYPFKNLMRGINCGMFGKYAPAIIQIIDSSSYYIPFLYGVKGVEIMVQNNCNPTIYIGDIENCEIKFTTIGTGTLTIKPIANNKRSTISLSRLLFYGNNSNSIIFNNIQLVFNECTYVSTRRTKWENTEAVSSGYAIQMFDGSFFIDCFDTRTLAGSDKWAYIASNSIIATPSADVTKGGTTAIISLTS